MPLTNYKLGDLIEQNSVACGISNLTANEVSGVNRDKEFFEPTKQVGSDTSNYQIVEPKHFACNLMHVGRDCLLPVAQNCTSKNKYVSPAYSVFKLKEDVPLLSTYFLMALKSTEKDRYFWFHADGSIRDGMSWDDFCNTSLSLPPLPIQQKYVDVYTSLVQNAKAFEAGAEDLKLVCDGFIDKLKHSAKKQAFGELLQLEDNRNVNNEIKEIKGINIDKVFMPTVADTSGLNYSNYKVVQHGQFAFSGMQTGRDKCIRFALQNSEVPIIISPAYTVFSIKDKNVVPEYIMMWFSREEIDREGWFRSDSSVRSNLDLDRFYEMEIPIPPLETQKSIVNIFNAMNSRKKMAEELRQKIKEICPVLIKGSIDEGKAAD